MSHTATLYSWSAHSFYTGSQRRACADGTLQRTVRYFCARERADHPLTPHINIWLQMQALLHALVGLSQASCAGLESNQPDASAPVVLADPPERRRQRAQPAAAADAAAAALRVPQVRSAELVLETCANCYARWQTRLPSSTATSAGSQLLTILWECRARAVPWLTFADLIWDRNQRLS